MTNHWRLSFFHFFRGAFLSMLKTASSEKFIYVEFSQNERKKKNTNFSTVFHTHRAKYTWKFSALHFKCSVQFCVDFKMQTLHLFLFVFFFLSLAVFLERNPFFSIHIVTHTHTPANIINDMTRKEKRVFKWITNNDDKTTKKKLSFFCEDVEKRNAYKRTKAKEEIVMRHRMAMAKKRIGCVSNFRNDWKTTKILEKTYKRIMIKENV